MTTRQIIQGIQTLRYPDGPYVEVAERIRILHKMGKDFRLHQTETMLVSNQWIYRVTLLLNGHHYIGDAEIHFGAPKETPDGTNPISCSQTSAVGNALSFAGFGDLRLLLEWQNLDTAEGQACYPTEHPHGEFEGIRVVWLDETTYVPVAERLYILHKLGHILSMDHCDIICVNGIWVYRVSIRIDERSYIADAEVHFAAPETTPERRYPVSSAQTAAVGNALALAGFGDLRTMLERMGKEGESILCTPSLASADAVSQAKRQRQADRGMEREQQTIPPISTTKITLQQQAMIRDLSARLGEHAPQAMGDWTFDEAETYCDVLRMQIDDLLETASAAQAILSNDEASPPVSSEEAIANYTEIGQLKRAWMQAFHIEGTSSAMKREWEAFKRKQCQMPVDDDAMLQSQYRVLKHVIDQHASRKTVQPSSENGLVTQGEENE